MDFGGPRRIDGVRGVDKFAQIKTMIGGDRGEQPSKCNAP